MVRILRIVDRTSYMMLTNLLLRLKLCFSRLYQILAYLLMSASSSAATRVDDWISNWGGDEFTLMASSSIGMSFLAFIAFALSSLISGYNLCNLDSSWLLICIFIHIFRDVFVRVSEALYVVIARWIVLFCMSSQLERSL